METTFLAGSQNLAKPLLSIGHGYLVEQKSFSIEKARNLGKTILFEGNQYLAEPPFFVGKHEVLANNMPIFAEYTKLRSSLKQPFWP